MAKQYTYEVTGRLPFPVDMLRYDAAYPTDPRSVDTLTAALKGSYGVVLAPTEVAPIIRLRSNYPPTVDRWKSFGWRVENQEKH